MRRRFAALLAVAACARPVDLVATATDAAHDDAPVDGGKDLGVPEIGDPTPGPHPACSPGTRIVVLGDGNMLYTFDPATNEVTELGVVSCPELGDPKLMAVAVDDEQLMYFAGADAQIVVLAPGTTKGCKQYGKLPAPPAANVALTLWSDAKPLMYVGLDQALFRSPPDPMPNWQVVGKLPSDPIVALVGTGDTRLYAVLPPVTKTDYRVVRLDPESGMVVGGTVLVPAGALAPDPAAPAGFALWGDTLFIFTPKQIAKYAFSTGDTGARAAPLGAQILGAASPPCASTLD